MLLMGSFFPSNLRVGAFLILVDLFVLIGFIELGIISSIAIFAIIIVIIIVVAISIIIEH